MDTLQAETTTAMTAAGHTDLSAIADALRAALDDYLAGRTQGPVADTARDGILARYRVVAQERVFADLDKTIASIEALYAAVVRERNIETDRLASEAGLLARLRDLRARFRATDPYKSGVTEEQCWLLVQQFHYDAIECVGRLLDWESGKQPAPLPHDADGAIARVSVMGIAGPSRRQAILNVLEVAVPNPIESRVLSTFLSTLGHMLWHQFNPRSELRWHEFLRTTLGWVSRDGLSRLRGERREVVRVSGSEYLYGERGLFDRATGKTAHNVVVAASHRLGFLDIPLYGHALDGLPHFVWANNSFYPPGMERKFMRSRTAIPVRGAHKLPLNEVIDLSIRVFEEDGSPLFIMADGATKNLLYGQYLRVKRGIRVLVDECVRQCAGTGRRTFVLPMTLDDPIAYLLGYEDEIRVNLHPPIEITEATSPDAHTSLFDESAFNGGDDLLNHLEALYFVYSVQARVGLTSPDVVSAVRAWRGQGGGGVRGWLRRRFNMSVYDLCRMTAAQRRAER
ncbi:MAG: hypothetical protein H6817_02085 [Phycisphaerales bacterium]|nr:hypothetical protein [Phycisphaerales bacterium]